MSYRIVVQVKCDDCGRLGTSFVSKRTALVTMARSDAKTRSWEYSDGHHRCPLCISAKKEKD